MNIKSADFVATFIIIVVSILAVVLQVNQVIF